MSYQLVLYRWDLAAKNFVDTPIVKQYKRFGNALKVAMKVAQQSKEVFDLPADIPDEFRPTTMMNCAISATYPGCTESRKIVSIRPEEHVDDNEVRAIELIFKVGEEQYKWMEYYKPIKNNEDYHAFLKKYNEYKMAHCIL